MLLGDWLQTLDIVSQAILLLVNPCLDFVDFGPLTVDNVLRREQPGLPGGLLLKGSPDDLEFAGSVSITLFLDVWSDCFD